MENVIKSIIELDRQARERTNEALENRQQAISRLEQQKEEIRQTELSKAKETVDAARRSIEAKTAELIEKSAAKEKKVFLQLDEAYEKNAARWADAIAAKTVAAKKL